MLECKKSILNIWFIIPFLLGCILVIMHIIYTVANYESFINKLSNSNDINFNPCLPIYTSINLWIGNSKTIYSQIYFNIIPYLCSLPYSWSYCYELKKSKTASIESNIIYIQKYISVFVSSGLVISLPLLINFFGISLYIPTYKPDSVYDIYYGMFSNGFLSGLFYNSPLFYILIVIILNFIFGGLMGGLGLSISTIIKSKFIAVTSPALILLLITFVKNNFLKYTNIDISPISFIFPSISQSVKCLIVITEIVIFVLFSLILPITRGNKHEM